MDWLRLLRLALLPSIIWDLVAGVLLVGATFDRSWLMALVAGILIYHSGMVANDIADRGLDRIHRPRRPLASGAIGITKAWLVLVLMLSGAWLLAAQSSSAVADLVKLLTVLVLVYDFGGNPIRRSLGPALLAAARAASLCLGALAVISPDQIMSSPLVWAAASYAMYFLFVSRLATNEESGASGMRILALATTAACAPILLFNRPDPHLIAVVPTILGAFVLLRPVIALRHQQLSPAEVQTIVRRMLGAAPMIPALALLVEGLYLPAIGGPIASIAIYTMARRLPPE